MPGQSMELRTAQPPIELEGTHCVILRSSGTPPLLNGPQSTVLPRNGGRECGAIVERTESGDNAIAIGTATAIYRSASGG